LAAGLLLVGLFCRLILRIRDDSFSIDDVFGVRRIDLQLSEFLTQVTKPQVL
jgi:hypothetical protein